MGSARPPWLPRVLLRWLVPVERREDVEGDLLELFAERSLDSPGRRARLRYWVDVLSIIRRTRRLRQQATTSRQSRETTMTSLWTAAASELRYALRGLAKRPAYAGVATLTLALGIGATVAIFTVLNAVLLRALPYPEADRIVEIVHHAPGLNMAELRSSPGLTAHYRDQARTLGATAGYEARQVNVSGAGAAERVRAIAASPGIFDVLATRPALGRGFHDADTDRDARPVTILTDGLWRGRFGSDPSVLGRTVELDGRPAEIIGVMPPGFSFPDADTRLFVPLRLDPEVFGAFGTVSIARLAPGATVDAARGEIAQLQQRIPQWYPDISHELLARFDWSSSVVALQERVVASVARTLWILFGTVGLVLLVAAANVANLFLVRAESRQREVAVKAALGAGRSRIALSFLAEGLVLATLGGLLGALLAGVGTRLLVAYGPPRLPRLQEVQVDAAVVAFAAALSLLSAVLLALLPMLNLRRRSFVAQLRDGGRGSTAGRSRHRVRQSLIVVQVAMALVLLVGAGLMVKSVVRLSAVDPGFEVDGLLTVAMSVGAHTDPDRALALYHRALSEMARLPGVAATAAAGVLPVAATSMTGSGIEIRSRPLADNEPPFFTMHTGVTAGYFETLGAPLFAGRALEGADEEQRRPVVWVNRTFARQYLNDRALGESIKVGESWVEIVGVVGDLRTMGLRDEVRPMAYLPLTHPTVKLDVLYAVVRGRGDVAALGPSIRAAVDRVDPTMPLTIRTMEEIVSASLAQTTFAVFLLAVAAAIGLVLGIVGLYGAVSYIAAQRTSEIAVRLALGAAPWNVCAMVLRQGAWVTAVGIAIGLVAAWWSARLLGAMLYEVSAHDTVTYISVSLLLILVSGVATYLPARRASAVDPVRALREEA